MAKGIPINTISKVVQKAVLSRTPVTAGLQISRTASKELLGYDFIGLIIKLVVFFTVAFVFTKFMEAQLFFKTLTPESAVRGASSLGLFGLGGVLLNLFIPKSESVKEAAKPLTENKTIVSLFSEEGFHGFQFWDFVKITAIILVLFEAVNYSRTNRNLGGKSSPMTIGVFIMIIAALGVTTIPELYTRIKKIDFNKKEFV